MPWQRSCQWILKLPNCFLKTNYYVGNEQTYTLKLDASWRPIEVIDSFKAFNMCYSGRAQVVREYEDEDKYPFPAVIVLKKYISTRRINLHCNRKNVAWRDNNTCQYCGKKFKFKEITMDHVIPKSRGGEKVWMNIVAACKKCNNLKNDRTPEEAKMPLIKEPYVPEGNIFSYFRGISIPDEWNDFL